MELTPFFFGLYKLVKYGVYPLTWIALFAGGTMVLAWLPPSPARRRLVKLAASGTVLVLYLVTAPFVASPLMSLLEEWPQVQPIPPDARFGSIVVLSGGLHEQGSLRPTAELSGESLARTTCAVGQYRRGHAETMFITGGTTDLSGLESKEADLMKAWAERLGVPPEAVKTETRARTTYENAVETKRALGTGAPILLVTSAYHLARAQRLFEKQGFSVVPYACDFRARNRAAEAWDSWSLFDIAPSVWALEQTTAVAEEIAGILVYRLAGKL